MNKLVTMQLQSTKHKNIYHALTVSVHESVLKNKKRLEQHCRSLAKKTYGNTVGLEFVMMDGKVIWDCKNDN